MYLVHDINLPNHEFCFGPVKGLFSFSTAQAEKVFWKKLGKTRFVVWWLDVTHKITRIKSFKNCSIQKVSITRLFFLNWYSEKRKNAER